MIELLMVIMIVALLGSAATTQFLDFRNEGKKAAVQHALSTMRQGIANQKTALRLRCTNFNNMISGFAINYNDVTLDNFYSGGAWNCANITGTEKKLFDGPISRNQFKAPYPGFENVLVTGVSGPQGCGNLRDGDPLINGSEYAASWLYNLETGDIWANSNTAGVAECNL